MLTLKYLFLILMSKESFCGILSNLQTKPTRPIKYGFNSDLYKKTARSSVNDLDNDTGYMWEKSGLLEGDIMTYRAEERNGIRGGKYVWYDATIPFYIEADDFDAEQIETILDAMDEFNYKTCIRFRPFVKSDRNWIVITGNETGCWSSVGMQEEGGQQLNLQAPECLKQGEIMHELLHAAGFYHQHSNRVRDNYVQINWENIEEGHESDFQKHNITIEYGTKYDYDSIMHYSRKAFSKNGNDTIVPLDESVKEFGQRERLSDIDLSKLNQMYIGECHKPDKRPFKANNIVDWFKSFMT